MYGLHLTIKRQDQQLAAGLRRYSVVGQSCLVGWCGQMAGLAWPASPGWTRLLACIDEFDLIDER